MQNLSSMPAKTAQEKFRRNLVRAIILPIILLGFMTALFLFQINRLLETVERVEHTDLVIADANRAQKLILDMETGLRGFVITGQDEFLEPFNSGSQQSAPTLDQLSQRVSDNPDQVRKVESIRAKEAKWLKYANEVIALRKTQGEYIGRIKSGEGKQIMDSIRADFTSFIDTEETLRNVRTVATKSATNFAVISGLAAGLLVGFILAVFVRRQVVGVSELFGQALENEKQQSEWLGTTLTSIGDAVIATDANGNVTLMNRVAESVTGWTNEEAKGKTLPEVFRIINEESRLEVESPVVKVLREGQIVGLANHTILITKDGSEVPIDDSGAPIKDSKGKIAGVVLVFRDITDRKKIEQDLEKLFDREKALRAEAETANHLKDQFFSNASHELRTPLSAIVGWIRMLRRGTLDAPTTTAALETIERNAHAQTKLIDDLLDMSRIMSGKLNVNLEPIDALPVVTSTVNSLLPSAEAKAISIKTVATDQPWPVLADGYRLQQVIWNLLTNAIKFTPKGGEIIISLQRFEDQLELAVKDNGDGIEPEFLPFVFERFRQADGSETRRHGGLGLGLAIVRNLVDLQRGSVTASSDGAGKGATFAVRLPLIGPDGADQNSLWKARRESSHKALMRCPPELQNIKVLVVDDDRDTREMLEALLTQCSASVRTASSTTEALRELERSRPDVLVSDLGMPDEDGYELIKRIRAMEAVTNSKALPALALTAYARPDDRVRALTAGYHVHLSKPVDPEEFALVVSNLLGRA
jgi:PAS domain S-box-containing protein